MARHPPELFDNEVCLPVMVIDAVDHGVLKGDAPPGLAEIVVAGGEELLHIVGPVHRHDFGAGLAVRRVKGHREGQLQPQLRQTPDAGDHAAGGKGDMAHADVHAVRVVHQLQKPQDIVQIVHGLSNTHQHDVGDLQSGIQLGEEHLVQHLRGRQVPDLAGDGGSAEGAAHAAPYLGGDTHGVAVMVLHQNRLDTVAVGELPEVLGGAVQPGDLLALPPGHGQNTLFPEGLPQGGGEIGHLIEGGDAPVEPGEHLLAPEAGLPQLLEVCGDLPLRHGFQIGHNGPHVSRRVMRQM